MISYRRRNQKRYFKKNDQMMLSFGQDMNLKHIFIYIKHTKQNKEMHPVIAETVCAKRIDVYRRSSDSAIPQ